jgi:glycerol kinase
MAVILAIDQGTTNTKALLVGPDGTILAQGSVPTGVTYPQAGWVEQDPLEIWHSTLEAVARCLAAAERVTDGVTAIAAIAIANQRETALLWERTTGLPVGPAVVWQCRRSAPFCEQLRAHGLEPMLRARTGLQVDPMFSGSKVRWLLDHAGKPPSELCAGNVDAWLLWHLTGGAVHATDLTNASRTQLLNLADLTWDDEILALFGIPRAALPVLRPSSAVFGETVPIDLPSGATLPGGIPIASMIGDSHASLFGLGGFRRGAVKATYGTGTSLMSPTPAPIASANGLSTTIAWAHAAGCEAPAASLHSRSPHSRVTSPSVVFALEGNIYTTGGAVQWIGDLLGLDGIGATIEALARSVPDAGGVTFVPALVGLGAPHWAPSARGLVTGLSLGTGRAHLARAALDAIAFQVRDVFDAMQADAGVADSTLLVDGGASRNDLLMQLQADAIGCPVERSRSSDVSALGAAFLAGLTIGLWHDETTLEALIPPRDRFEPAIDSTEREMRHLTWRAALARTLYEP